MLGLRATLLLVLALPPLTACGASRSWARADEFREPDALPPAAALYVAVPEDGRYEERVWEGSGRKTAEAVAEAFRPHAAVVVGGGTESTNQALASAREQQRTHVLVPRIEHWEDRATEWSGRRDRLRVQLELLSVPDGGVLDRVTIEGASSLWTFGDRPEDLLRRPLVDYAVSLF